MRTGWSIGAWGKWLQERTLVLGLLGHLLEAEMWLSGWRVCVESLIGRVPVRGSSWAPAVWWQHWFPRLCLVSEAGERLLWWLQNWLGNWVGQKQLMTGTWGGKGCHLRSQASQTPFLVSVFFSPFYISTRPTRPVLPPTFPGEILLFLQNLPQHAPCSFSYSSIRRMAVLWANFGSHYIPDTVLSSCLEFPHWILTTTW